MTKNATKKTTTELVVLKPVTDFRKQIQLRRERVRGMHFQCMSVRTIARKLRVPQSTIWRDLDYFERRWREGLPHHGYNTLAEEIDRLHYLEGEAWKAWKRSEKTVTMESTYDGDVDEKARPKSSRKIVKSKAGDGRFLQLIAQCIMRRCQLLKFYSTEDIDGQDIAEKFEIMCQAKQGIAAILDQLRNSGSLEDFYTRLLGINGQPGSLEIGAAFGAARRRIDGTANG